MAEPVGVFGNFWWSQQERCARGNENRGLPKTELTLSYYFVLMPVIFAFEMEDVTYFRTWLYFPGASTFTILP